MEGSGRQPNIGQNVTPDAPLPDWAVPEFNRVAQFPFSMANDVRQNMVLT